jgi:hypothetical protein
MPEWHISCAWEFLMRNCHVKSSSPSSFFSSSSSLIVDHAHHRRRLDRQVGNGLCRCPSNCFREETSGNAKKWCPHCRSASNVHYCFCSKNPKNPCLQLFDLVSANGAFLSYCWWFPVNWSRWYEQNQSSNILKIFLFARWRGSFLDIY